MKTLVLKIKSLLERVKILFSKKSTWILLAVSAVIIHLVAPNNSVGDWRKGSSASLQATISIDQSAFRDSNLDDSILVQKSSDYEQCIKDVVINPTWCTPSHDVIATCSTTSSGICWAGENSNFELKFHNSDGTYVGYIKFHEPYATHFEVKDIQSYNGYLVSCKTISTADRHSNFEVTISVY
jgi:hypothetical protein